MYFDPDKKLFSLKNLNISIRLLVSPRKFSSFRGYSTPGNLNPSKARAQNTVFSPPLDEHISRHY